MSRRTWAGRLEAALIQNEITNIFENDFAVVGEEDAVSGSRKENVITEYQSFTDLNYSKNKVVSYIQWLPHRKVAWRIACQTPWLWVLASVLGLHV